MSILSKNKLAIIVIAMLAVSLLFASVTFAPVRGPEPTNADLMDQLGDIAVNVWSLRYINWEDSDGDDIHNFLEPIYNMLNDTGYGLKEIKNEIIDIIDLMGNVSDTSSYNDMADILDAIESYVDDLDGPFGLNAINNNLTDIDNDLTTIINALTSGTYGLEEIKNEVSWIENAVNGTEINSSVSVGTSSGNYTIYTYTVPASEGPKVVSCTLFIADPTAPQSAGEFESGDEVQLHMQIMKNGVWYNRTSGVDSWMGTSKNGMYVLPGAWTRVPVAEGIRFIIEREANEGDADTVWYCVIVEDS
jgi:hypothetical protein